MLAATSIVNEDDVGVEVGVVLGLADIKPMMLMILRTSDGFKRVVAIHIADVNFILFNNFTGTIDVDYCS